MVGNERGRRDCTHSSSDGVYTLQRKTKHFTKKYIAFRLSYDSVHILFCVCYLAGRTFLHGANNSLSGQVNQDVGAVIIQGHVVAIKCDDTQVRHHGAATWQKQIASIKSRSFQQTMDANHYTCLLLIRWGNQIF